MPILQLAITCMHVCYLHNLFCRNKLQLGDAFVGFQEDTPAAVVFQAYDHLKATQQWEVDDKMSEEQKDQVKLQLINMIFLNQACQPLPWFLRIAFVHECLYACVCLCVHPRAYE